MTKSTGKKPRQPKKRRRTASIGGTSQSAFAGYAPKTSNKRPKCEPSAKTEVLDADG